MFSSWGLREGLLYQALDGATGALDPFDAGLGAFVSLYGIAPDQVQNVADWAAPIAVGKAKPSRERIRRGAIALALAAARIEPNLRASHAVDWALGKRFIGIRPKDRIMLAAAMLANSGKLNVPESWRTIASPDNLREAQGWGLTMRLSRRFCGNFPAALDLSALLLEGEMLILRVDPSCSALITDSVQRRLKQLADLLAMGSAVRIAPTITHTIDCRATRSSTSGSPASHEPWYHPYLCVTRTRSATQSLRVAANSERELHRL